MSDARLDVAFSASTDELEAGTQRAAAAVQAMCATAIAALQQLAAASTDAMAKFNQAMSEAGGQGQSGGKNDPAKQQAASWRAGIAEITSAESGFVRNIFSGRQSLSQSLIAMGRQVVESEISNDLRYYTSKVLYNLLGVQSDQQTAQAGLLTHLFTNQEKAESDRDVTARHIINEDRNADATMTGNAIQLASTQSTAAASAATETTSTLSSITKHAASAAAAVYDSVAQIPYVGWVLAPIAAGAAFVAVEAYGALMPSFDSGAWNLPQDMVAQVHAGESVIPAGIAGSMRDFFAGGGADGDAGGGNVAVTFNVSSMDGASVLSTLKRNQGALMSVIRDAVRNGASVPAGAVR
ncbi:MAG TPA: hypothetical protein VMC10_14145 [Stellaceae bacterium]|nr:hypothetical protein [Stellaceae bacterium]